MPLAIEVHLDYDVPEPCAILLQIEAAAMVDQRLVSSGFAITSEDPLVAVEGEDSIGQRSWATAHGNFRADYLSVVAIDRALPDLRELRADPLASLPGLVIPYLMPSRYCESDEFESFVQREFPGLDGGEKIAAMADWIARNIDYVSGASDVDTTAVHTFVQRKGVCRDFAHLMTSFARAAGIPARLVSAYAPKVEPPDFHAVVELWLGGGWHLLDPTGMADPADIVRIGVGRDATDIAFMTVFGAATLNSQSVTVTRTP